MIINWICRQKNWAYGHLCKHLAKKMPKHKHEFDGKDGDVNFIVSPGYLKGNDLSKSILHVDSNRWYENESSVD